MRHINHLVAAGALAGAGLTMASGTAQAQAPAQVTVTFKLTINGTPPAHDAFLVKWGESGLQLCAPCTGGGHTYVQTTPWPKGTAFINLRYSRVPVSASDPTAVFRAQDFAHVALTPEANVTVNAVFTYGNAAGAVVPSTGGGSASATGPVLLSGGIALLVLALGFGLARRVHWPQRVGERFQLLGRAHGHHDVLRP
jgi:hypothetical protein